MKTLNKQVVSHFSLASYIFKARIASLPMYV